MSELIHYGTPRRSGRYPYGSGNEPYQNAAGFLGHIAELKKKGLSEKEISQGLGIPIARFRDFKTLAIAEKDAEDLSRIYKLKEKGYSNTAIGMAMGINESSVRSKLTKAERVKNDMIDGTSGMLKNKIDTTGDFIDVGKGVENRMGISREKLRAAVSALEAEGYVLHEVKVEQLTTGEMTTMKVLTPPGTSKKDIYTDLTKIKVADAYTEDGGKAWDAIKPPVQINPKRIQVIHKEDGGEMKDGVIELRRGVADIDLLGSNYSQVRIAVDGTHYIKGMAVYGDDFPKGVDIRFNTNKPKGTPMLGDKDNSVLKPLTDDADYPFKTVVRQKTYVDKDGKQQLSALNIVNDEGDWGNWSKTLSSQMLSKQSSAFAKERLGKAEAVRRAEFDEIMELTNPVVKRKLLEGYADAADSAAVHLKAAAMPRQASQVILPINSLRENQIYAPNFKNGESVVLIRHPHGGIFEIPELTVNNRNQEARRVLGTKPKDAVGINHKVAARLSGADFDGDTVLVIPNGDKRVKTAPALKGLKDFDPKSSYPGYKGMKVMSDTQKQMGDISNLITDMTIKKANQQELAQAVRHSMVVIDAEKHKLNYKLSARENGISNLKAKYQKGPTSGADTLISASRSRVDVAKRKPRTVPEGGPIDPKTGKKMFTPTGEGYVDKKGIFRLKTQRSSKMAETDDAFTLSSGTTMEGVYAAHANKMKALGNQARKETLAIKNKPASPSAKTAYAKEVAALNDKLNRALKNAPLERQAQVIGNAEISAIKKAMPDIESGKLKKLKANALKKARIRLGAGKENIEITDREWEAIQAGAISPSKLTSIVGNSDLDRLKQLATPKTQVGVTQAQKGRINAMLAAGYTQADVATALGISTSTVNKLSD